MKNIFSIAAITILGTASLLGVAGPAKAQVACVHDGVDTAVCVDDEGNAAVSSVDEDGNQVTVDSDGNVEVELSGE